MPTVPTSSNVKTARVMKWCAGAKMVLLEPTAISTLTIVSLVRACMESVWTISTPSDVNAPKDTGEPTVGK